MGVAGAPGAVLSPDSPHLLLRRLSAMLDPASAVDVNDHLIDVGICNRPEHE